MKVESLKKLKSMIEKCIEDLSQKSDLTPNETKAALDGIELRSWLCKEIEDCEMDEGYSERKRYSREGNGSYHMGYSGYPRYGVGGWYHNDAGPSYCDPYAPGYMYGSDPGYSERRQYSRHSIADRAVEKLENMMDSAGSDYERQELLKFIHMIRQAE